MKWWTFFFPSKHYRKIEDEYRCRIERSIQENRNQQAKILLTVRRDRKTTEKAVKAAELALKAVNEMDKR